MERLGQISASASATCAAGAAQAHVRHRRRRLHHVPTVSRRFMDSVLDLLARRDIAGAVALFAADAAQHFAWSRSYRRGWASRCFRDDDDDGLRRAYRTDRVPRSRSFLTTADGRMHHQPLAHRRRVLATAPRMPTPSWLWFTVTNSSSARFGGGPTTPTHYTPPSHPYRCLTSAPGTNAWWFACVTAAVAVASTVVADRRLHAGEPSRRGPGRSRFEARIDDISSS